MRGADNRTEPMFATVNVDCGTPAATTVYVTTEAKRRLRAVERVWGK